MSEQQLVVQFQSVDDRLNRAFESNNTTSISNLLSPSWILIESAFGITNKRRFLTAIETGDLLHTSMIKKVLNVRITQGVAIVTTRGMNIGSYKDAPFSAEQWVTNIFKEEKGDWICMLTQETPVACTQFYDKFVLNK